ncbi:MAG: flagellin [Lachnospiraceae bacterium]|nr:flagellin [Lachnospiraceae bacterium]
MSLSIGTNYQNLSSGYRINSAADDASGLSISEKLKSEITIHDVATENAELGNNLLNVADGALGNLQDSLGRIREIAVQASNTAVYSEDELSMMQSEVDKIKQSIADVAKNTQFNGHKLLDGSMADLNLATNPTGKGQEIKLVNATLEALGIEDFDVTKDFNIEDIDNAIKQVNEARSGIGAESNRLAYTIMSNQNTSYNLTASNSRIRDTDMAEEIMKLQKNNVMEQVQILMQKKKMEEEQQKRNNFFV